VRKVRNLFWAAIGLALIALGFCASAEAFTQGNDRLTPLQSRIEQQKQRLSSWL